MEQVVVSGVTYNKNEAKVTVNGVPDRPGVASRIFTTLADANIVIDMIVQNVSHDKRTDITFTLGKADAKKAQKIMEGLATEIGAETVEVDERISKVSIVGLGMRSHAGIAAKMFALLSGEGINIEMIGTSEIKVSCVIDQKYGELAVRALHTGFGLDANEDVQEER